MYIMKLLMNLGTGMIFGMLQIISEEYKNWNLEGKWAKFSEIPKFLLPHNKENHVSGKKN